MVKLNIHRFLPVQQRRPKLEIGPVEPIWTDNRLDLKSHRELFHLLVSCMVSQRSQLPLTCTSNFKRC